MMNIYKKFQVGFKKLESEGLRLNKDKCVFMAPSIRSSNHRGRVTSYRRKGCVHQTSSYTTEHYRIEGIYGIIELLWEVYSNFATVLSPLYHLLKISARVIGGQLH